MIVQLTAVTAMFTDLPAQELTGWIERGWVQPETAESGWVFQEIDIARVRLIHDLRRDMDIGEETIPMVLSLLDQVYELRARLKAVLHAVEAQPEGVREAIRISLSRVS
jgi:chaperone modulatory protein CbpM